MMAIDADKRKHPRRDEDALVRFQGENFAIYSNAKNLGSGGIFLNTYYLLNQGTRLNLQFEVPSTGKTVGVDGEVVWQGRTQNPQTKEELVGMGIRFVDLKEEDARLISSFASNA